MPVQIVCLSTSVVEVPPRLFDMFSALVVDLPIAALFLDYVVVMAVHVLFLWRWGVAVISEFHGVILCGKLVFKIGIKTKIVRKRKLLLFVTLGRACQYESCRLE